MKKLVALLLFIMPLTIFAQAVQVNGVRAWPAPDNTRLVFDLSGPAGYKMFRLHNPERLVIDLKDTELMRPIARSSQNKDSLINKIRTAKRGKKNLRVVLDLNGQPVHKSFILKPYQDYGHRLVVDLFKTTRKAKPKVVRKTIKEKSVLRDVVIAIDAGHGGMDPGARGHKGTREKVVVLGIARKLAAMIEAERGMRPVLIRNGDYFLSLRKRTAKAREHQADLLVSIHADAFKDKRVKGMSVYVLSKNGATSEAARWLAEKENAADLIGGVTLDDKDNLLASVLLDLSQNSTIEESFKVGNAVLAGMKPIGKLHKKKVQQAGFAVLKSPDIPSILVETAFISNPDEERKLRTSSHQKTMAKAILSGIQTYFVKNAPPGTLYAARQHVIARGDTLSEIAKRYDVSMTTLRNINRLNSNTIKIGQVLRIPTS